MSLRIACCLTFFFLIYLVISTLLQEIQIYSIQTVDEVVLGLARKRYRVILPSCAVNKIRQTFPSETYTGFKYPALS